tara:strand:+ start:795 stop:1532 length:738 start_codon:yes stop_codon:yes gene_type:complete
MARLHGKDTDFFVDEHDFAGVVMNLTLGLRQVNGEVTAFADTDATFVEGKLGWVMGANGLWSAASPNYDSEMFTDLTATDRLLGIWPNASTAGERGFEGQSNISSTPRTSEKGSAISLDVEWQGNADIMRPFSMHRDTSFTSTANGTPYQVGAIGATQTGVSILRAFSVSGTSPTLDVVIASDNAEGFSSGTTRITHTQLTAAGFERSTVGTVTDDWWRAQMTIGGSNTPTFDMFVAFGIINRAG